MIISRTPFRISFFGGGTDYPAWYRENGGAVLATTINKYCYLSVRRLPPFFEYRWRILYSQVEHVNEVSEIKHPAVRAVLGELAITDGLEIHHDADLPARTGLGSSSTFTVGLLHALHAYRGVMPERMQLAREAIRIEQDVLHEVVGVQDQTLAAVGGFNRLEFLPNDEIEISPVTIPAARVEELESHLMLVFTGFTRIASEIAVEQVRQVGRRRAEMTAIRASVDEAVRVLVSGADIMEFGRLLHDAWQLKKSLSDRISNAKIDGCYDAARAAGAVGGKILGAGGGGFMLFFVPPSCQDAMRERLGLMRVPFRFERTGSRIIFYDPENLRG